MPPFQLRFENAFQVWPKLREPFGEPFWRQAALKEGIDFHKGFQQIRRGPGERSGVEQFQQRGALFLAVAAGLNYGDRAVMSSMLPALRSDLGLSDVALGMLGSVFLGSFAFGSPIAGSLADQWSRRKLVGVGTWTFLNWLPLYFRDTFHLTLVVVRFAG